jgi:hypothetical protein
MLLARAPPVCELSGREAGAIILRTFAAFLVVSVSLAGPAWAQITSAQRAACTPDAFKFCGNLIPDIGKIIPCLRAQKASLSAGCRAVFDAADRKPATTRSSTSADSSEMALWCAPDRSSARRDDVWTAWCEEPPRRQ